MKRFAWTGIMIVWGLLCIGIDGRLAQAAETPPERPPDKPEHGIFGERFSLDVGWKFWVAKWQVQGTINNAQGTRTSDTTTLTGPSVTGSFRLRDDEWLNRVSVNFTWLQAGGFDFSPFGTNVGNSSGPSDVSHAIRRDYSIVGALSIWRGFGIFGGYYHQQQRFNQSFTQLTFNTNNVWISGPVIGIYGTGTVTGPLKAYGNVSLGLLDLHSQTTTGARPPSAEAQGYATEVGLSYDGPSLKTGLGTIGSAIQAGFRAQVISINQRDGTANTDVTWGPTFQLVARF